MWNIIKCIIIFFLELNIYQCIGYAIGRFKHMPDESTFLLRIIYGFLGYHVVFWCIAFPCTIWNKSLDMLSLIWGISLCAILLVIGIRYLKKIIALYCHAAKVFWKFKTFFIPCLIFGIIVIYYVCVNGQVDLDAQTYIGEVTSMVDTGKLAGVFVKTGAEADTIALKRSFAIFGENSAALCNIFDIHPLIFCRTTRAAINIVLFGAATFEIFRWIFRYQENVMEQAAMCTMLTQGALFAFANTIFTASRFLLFRAYEGKAYSATTLILFTILIAIKLCDSTDKRYFFLLFMDMLAGMSISASATFILPVAGVSIILAHALWMKKWIYIPLLFLSVLPNMIYLLLGISGFAGFHLEG